MRKVNGDEVLLQGDVPMVPVEDQELIKKILSEGVPVKNRVVKHGETGNTHTIADVESDLVQYGDTLYWVVKNEGILDHQKHFTQHIKVEKTQVYNFIPKITEYDPLNKKINEQRD
jgi:hypothetical protein